MSVDFLKYTVRHRVWSIYYSVLYFDISIKIDINSEENYSFCDDMAFNW